jgi:two-component system response regulator NreC
MLIDAQPDMVVVGDAENANDAIAGARELRPDVVLLDITMPGGSGLSAISAILKSFEPVRVLLLTMHEEPAYLRTAIAAGASGYVLKRSVDAALLSAIRAVSRGRTYVDSELAATLVQPTLPETTREGRRPAEVLSERELEVLKLVAEGFSSREIAEQIFVGTTTVETYRGRFAEKLGLKSRADIVRYALETGLLATEKLTAPKDAIKRSRSK